VLSKNWIYYLNLQIVGLGIIQDYFNLIKFREKEAAVTSIFKVTAAYYFITKAYY